MSIDPSRAFGASSRRAAIGVAVAASCVFGLLGAPAGAAPIAYPDLQVLVPTEYTFIQHNAKKRLLEFEHITEDGGAGPLEIQPEYNSQTGVSQGYQALYTSPSPGHWSFDHTVPIVGPMVWHPPSDYAFPLTKFWLYGTNAEGGVGSLVATSPKIEFCMTSDVYVGNAPNTPEENEYPANQCELPNGRLGLTVGWGDQYDATDGGEGIDITSLPNGIYWLRAEVDPYHYLQESNQANNITDTKLHIEGNSVTTLEQTHPDSTPPSVTFQNPASGSSVSGNVQLEATASGPATISSVQFLLDGQPLGSPVATPPYKMTWSVGATTAGKHFLSAQATDSRGFTGTALDVPVTVQQSSGGGIAETFDGQVSQTGINTITTPGLSTSAPGDLLLAFADADGPTSGQSVTVSGGGLAWKRVKQSSAHGGDAEIWWAKASSTLNGATFSASELDGGFEQSLTVLALKGATGIGGSGKAGSAAKAPFVKLKSKAGGSETFATGVDPDRAFARTFSPGQAELVEFLREAVGVTFWTQYSTTRTGSAKQKVTLSDAAPAGDAFAMVGVEVLAGSSPPQDTEPPQVNIMSPTQGQQLSGSVQVSANASDNVAVGSVQFFVDGKAIGAPITEPPYVTTWNTAGASNGGHMITATALDTSGNPASSTPVSVTVENPIGEQPPCFVIDVNTSAQGHGAVTTSAFTNAEAGEQLLAFVSSDGPPGAGQQSVTVSGAGLTWTLVQRANGRSGDAEIWAAKATSALTGATVTSTPSAGGYEQSLTVISVEQTGGIGASATAGAAKAPPKVSLTTTAPGSLVFAVGNDYTAAIARTLGNNQVSLHEFVDTTTGDTYWSQYLGHVVSAAGTNVTMNDTAPANDEWNMAAVELLGDGG